MDNTTIATRRSPGLSLKDFFDNTWPITQEAPSLGLLDLPAHDPPQSISLTFFPGARGSEANVIFCTSDSVLFFVDTRPIFHISETAFREILDSASVQGIGPLVVSIPETSQVLDVMLHFLHYLPFSESYPQMNDLVDGVSRMSKYGLDPVALLTPANPCYQYILNLAPLLSLELYALAASLNIHHLAVTASSHLLNLYLPTLDNEIVNQIGPIYLQKLFVLHAHRRDKLKDILAKPPHIHPPTRDCNFDEQKKLSRAWTMVAGYFIWDAKCDLSPSAIHSQFESLGKRLDCDLCREMLAERIKDVITQWVQVKVSSALDPSESWADLA